MDNTECEMETGKLSAFDDWATSQLHLVLLGGRNSGKSHVGNLLLGREEFVTRERTVCSHRQGQVTGGGRCWLSVVDTPGWWCDFTARDTSELLKREIVSSVSLCSPSGPHAFLIVIKVSSGFSETRRRSVEEHVGLLGDDVWSHCIVVLISADRSKNAEEDGDENKALQWLSEKVNHRSHRIFWSDGEPGGVTELLQKIQKLVTENGNRAFEPRGSVLQEAVEEKRRVEEKARQRFMRVKEHRALMRERLSPITNIRIVLLGAKGSGKTSVMNTILGRGSTQPQRRTSRCVAERGAVFGRQVTVVDTPGWWMNYFAEETPAFDRREMVLGSSLCPPGPHVFLLVVRVDRVFSPTYRRAVREHVRLLGGRNIWSHVIVLFSFGDWLGETTTEQHIESEGEALRGLVERCGNRYHVLNNKTKRDSFQVRELIGKMEEMLAGCSGRGSCHFGMEREAMQRLEEEVRVEKERAQERRMKKEQQRLIARSQLEKLNPLPELRIVLFGGAKTGKTSCGNTILNAELFSTAPTQTCSERRARIHDRRTVTVLDTPGCFSMTSDLLAPCCALLLVVNASSSFTQTHLEALEEQLKAVEGEGDRVWSKCAVLFSHGDWLGGDTNIEERIESEGDALKRLVDKCGDRYHVLDNKLGGGWDQVSGLMELIDETLVGWRLGALHAGDHMCRSVSEQQMEAAGRCDKGLSSRAHQQLSSAVTEVIEVANPIAQTSLHCPEYETRVMASAGNRNGLAKMAKMDGDGLMSCLASIISGKAQLKWTVSVPAWLPNDDLNLKMRPNSESQVQLFWSKRPTLFLEGNGMDVSVLCHPIMRDRTLKRLMEDSGGLQTLLDLWGRQWGGHQWGGHRCGAHGNSSMEELEGFIDSYFETVWEQTMGSVHPAEPEPEPQALMTGSVVEEEVEVLSSIDRRLSKLELLDEIRSDVAELRRSLERSWRVIEELRGKKTNGSITTHDEDTGESHVE